MKMIKFLMIALVATLFLTSCTENYSNGERIGMITKFSQKGLVWNSWEGSLNTTQTGMNSATPFEFSVDNSTFLINFLILLASNIMNVL